MLIDTHAHLHFEVYDGQVDEIINRAEAAGVTKIITVGVNSADSKKAVALAQQYDNVWASVGLHPHDAANDGPEALATIKLLATKPKVVAIGECGFDFYRLPRDQVLQQERVFRAQIELAQELDLPLIFHVRDGFSDFFRVISDYPNVRGVVHSFSSNLADLEVVLNDNFYIALNGIMTYSKNPDQLEAAKRVPHDRLLLETDCPFLTPTPNRGKPNEPSFITLIVQFLADLRRETVEELSKCSTNNAKELFKI